MPRIARVNNIYDVKDGDPKEGHSGWWYVDSEIEMGDGSILFKRHVMPKDILEWRAAEYGIPPNDYDTLVDIVMAEPYIDADWYHSDKSLFYAPTIEEARANYLAKVAEVKLEKRISTRGKDHPLNFIKRNAAHNPMSMAIKAMSVLMQRHEFGTQEQDPEVVRVFLNFREAINKAFPQDKTNPDPEIEKQSILRGMMGVNDGR